MATLSYQEFIQAVIQWASANKQSIASKWPQKGGWEGWAQAEIASFILSKDSTYDLLREQAVYQSRRKAADFLLNSASDVQDVIVELKCQSFENYKEFVPGIESDVQKLIKELSPAYSGSALLVIGIYFTEQTQIPPYFSKQIIDGGEIGVCWAVDLNS